MSIKKLVLEITKREGLKKEVSVAQVREIIGHLCDVIFEEREENGISQSMKAIIENGAKRVRKSRRKNSKNT
jgi:hypothetical protein